MTPEVARALEQLATSIRNLDERLREVANRKPKLQEWQAFNYDTGWQEDISAGGMPAGYWKDPHGIVHLRGAVTRSSGVGTTIAFLPAGYAIGTNGLIQGYVVSDGSVTSNGGVVAVADNLLIYAVGTFPLFLDGISWRAGA